MTGMYCSYFHRSYLITVTDDKQNCDKNFYCTCKRKYVWRQHGHARFFFSNNCSHYSILARFRAMASSTAFSSRRSSSLLDEVFAVFDFPDAPASACESTDLLSGLLAGWAVTDDVTASLAWFEVFTPGDGSRCRFLAVNCFSLLLLASVRCAGECWIGALACSPLSGLGTDCKGNMELY